MNHRSLLPLVVALFALGEIAGAAPLIFPGDGFKIEPLAQPVAPVATHSSVAMLMPPTAGFSANVNVMVQAFDGTVDDFIATSKTQFTQMGATLSVDTKVGSNEWMFEYTGKLPQGDGHFYGRAVAGKGKMYLITATDLEAGWPAHGPALKKCVDSFASTQPPAVPAQVRAPVRPRRH